MESGADLREMGKFIQPQLLNLFTTFHSILQFILMFSDTKFMAAFFFFFGYPTNCEKSCAHRIPSYLYKIIRI